MKTIFSKAIGSDGVTVTLAIDEAAGNIVLGTTYPLAKVTGQADKALDALTLKVETALGNVGWINALIQPLDEAAKAELRTLLGAL